MTLPSALAAACPEGRLRADVALAGATTFRVGGSADWFVDATTTADLVAAVRAASEDGLAVTVLGGGSNVLVADAGVRGLVVRPRMTQIVREADARVRADAGVTINGLVRWTLLKGLGGLEAWAGTPGTVGGAICGNAHYGGRLVGESVVSARLLPLDGSVVDVPAEEMAFGYDVSRLQTSGEIVLSAVFRVLPGQDPAQLRERARQSLLHRKRTQPLHQPSAGCVFQNPDPSRDHLPPGMPWSAGALIDRAGLKGRRFGGASVSTVHANFIVNDRGATANDVSELIELCRREVRARFGVELREEIVRLGDFPPMRV